MILVLFFFPEGVIGGVWGRIKGIKGARGGARGGGCLLARALARQAQYLRRVLALERHVSSWNRMKYAISRDSIDSVSNIT